MDGNLHEESESYVVVVSAYCDAWLAGDVPTVLSMYHDDLELIWPGHHHLAGTYQGKDASITALLALQSLTNRVPVEINDITVGDHSVTVTVTERWSNADLGSQTAMLERVLEFTVVDAKLHTCRVHEADQVVVDDWIQHTRGGGTG